MGRKPSKLQAVKIPWDVYKEVKDQALEEDTTIKDVLVEHVEELPKETAKLEGKVDELKEKVRKLERENRDLKKRKEQLINENSKLKKQSGGKWEGYEEYDRETLKEALKEKISGVGEKKASKFVDVLRDEIKLIGPKEDE